MLWFYLDFPQLQLDSLMTNDIAQDSSITTPIIIVDGQYNRVVQANKAAIDCGVCLGFGLGRAISLSNQMQVHNYNSKLTQKLLQQITQSAYSVIADIAPMPPQGLLLRLSPMFALYGDLNGTAEKLKHWLNNLQLTYRGACALNPIAAQVIAQSLPINTLRISDDPHVIHDWLSNTSINYLDVADKIIEQLRAIGVHDIGQLVSLPAAQLSTRFDSEFLSYLNKLKGDVPALIDFYLPQTPFHYYCELHYELHTTTRLAPILQKVLAELSRYLRSRDKLALSVALTLHLREKANLKQPLLSFTISSAQGEQSASTWLNLISLQLERVELPAPTIAISLDCCDVIANRTISDDILSQASHNASRKRLSKAQLISLLHAKLGSEHVIAPSHHNSHLPEVINGLNTRVINGITAINGLNTTSQTKASVENQLTAPAQDNGQINDKLRAGLRPSYLLEKPQPLTMPVSIFHGPERLSGHWWQKHTITRDYYIARNEQLQWCWVFQIPAGQWFLHGYFG